MIQNCQDALAINHHSKEADFFLTMTANSNWPEIKAALLPGQSSADRPDLVNHVFCLRVQELMDDIYKQGFLEGQWHMYGQQSLRSVVFHMYI